MVPVGMRAEADDGARDDQVDEAGEDRMRSPGVISAVDELIVNALVRDPEAVRRFAADLTRFSTDLDNRMAALHARFTALGDTWQDQEHERRDAGDGAPPEAVAALGGPDLVVRTVSPHNWVEMVETL